MGASAAVFAFASAVLGALSPDAAVGARLEIMAGSAPVLPSEPPEASFAAELAPLAALELEDARFRLVLRYNPRLFVRRPNVLGLDRPIFLHRGSLDEQSRLSRTVTFRNSIQGSAGEVDYVGFAGILPPTQLSQVNLSVIRLYDVQDTVSLDVLTAPRSRAVLAAVVGRSGPLDGGTNGAFPVHTRAAFQPEFQHTLTRRDRLKTLGSFEFHRIEQTKPVDLAVQTAGVDWERTHDRRTTTTIGGGVLVAEPTNSDRDSSFIPVGSASVLEHLVMTRRARLDGRLGVAMTGVLNILRAEYRPLAGVSGALEFRHPPRLTAVLRASLFTAATSTPLTTGEPETFFSAEAPVVYTVSPNLALEAGARSSFRSPHLKEGIRVEQLQIWGYGAVTVLFGTADDPHTTVQ